MEDNIENEDSVICDDLYQILSEHSFYNLKSKNFTLNEILQDLEILDLKFLSDPSESEQSNMILIK